MDEIDEKEDIWGAGRRNTQPLDVKDVPKKVTLLTRVKSIFRPQGKLEWNAKDLQVRLQNSKRDRLGYMVDTMLSKTWRFFLIIVLLGFVQLVIGGFVYSLVWSYDPASEGGIDRKSRSETSRISESIWYSWTLMADPGTQSDRFKLSQRIISSVLTLGGILFFAVIIGITVDVIQERMDSIRKGKSRIIEKDHVLILGWTEKTVHIIEEICCANESEGGGVIAVMASHDKARMELDLQFQLPIKQRRGTRVVFRYGSPLVAESLIRVSVHMAKAIIILSSSGDADAADSDTLRTVLSLQSLGDNLLGHIVAEIRDVDNEPLLQLVGGKRVETMVAHDVIGRLMLMSVRQPGLAKVYEALLGFEGDEFYFASWPELTGICFGELQARFPAAIPIGIRTPDGTTLLKPSFNYIIASGDEVIVIAEDNDTYQAEPPVNFDLGPAPPPDVREAQQERILVCGWRRDIRDILVQLDKIAHPGTEVHMMTDSVPITDRERQLYEDGLRVDELKKLKLVHWFGNTSSRRKLDDLPLESFTSAMIFADQSLEADSLRSDSHSLATLLLIRDIQSFRLGAASLRLSGISSSCDTFERTMSDLNPEQRCPIICEVLDPHTQRTIACNKYLSLTADFCQTNKLVAQVLAMIAEERTVNVLFGELLGNTGCDIAVVPHSRYCAPSEHISFLGVARRAQNLNELVLGYQVHNSLGKTVLNPPNKMKQCRFDLYDFAILRGDAASGSYDV